MNIIPAIDLRHGKVVQLVQGDPANVAHEADLLPVEQANAWLAAGAQNIHLVDLDGAFGEKPQLMPIQQILRTPARVQLGGGVRSMLQIQQWIEHGANQIIIGTQGIENPDWLKEVAGLFPNRVILAVDAKGRNVVTKGWTEETGKDVIALAKEFAGIGLAGFLYTNVEKEGLMAGIDVNILAELRNVVQEELIVSGGFASMADLDAAAAIGVDGVVLGMSIYTGKINLGDAVNRFS